MNKQIRYYHELIAECRTIKRAYRLIEDNKLTDEMVVSSIIDELEKQTRRLNRISKKNGSAVFLTLKRRNKKPADGEESTQATKAA